MVGASPKRQTRLLRTVMESTHVSSMEKASQDQPLVSILMSTYREPAAWLNATIQSVLSQTYTHFEFIIICDDPANQEHRNILDGYQVLDKRIKWYLNETNIGLAASLNIAFGKGCGELIARMDADDIMMKDRLQKQIEFLKQNPTVSLVGSSVEIIDGTGEVTGRMRAPTNVFKATQGVRYKTTAFHPTWLMKRQVMEDLGGYSNLPVAQDYDFLLRCSLTGFKISNSPEPLIYYRMSAQSISAKKSFLQMLTQNYIQMLRLQKNNLSRLVDEAHFKSFVDSNTGSQPNFEKWSHVYNEGKLAVRSKMWLKSLKILQVYLFCPILRRQINKNVLFQMIRG